MFQSEYVYFLDNEWQQANRIVTALTKIPSGNWRDRSTIIGVKRSVWGGFCPEDNFWNARTAGSMKTNWPT